MEKTILIESSITKPAKTLIQSKAFLIPIRLRYHSYGLYYLAHIVCKAVLRKQHPDLWAQQLINSNRKGHCVVNIIHASGSVLRCSCLLSNTAVSSDSECTNDISRCLSHCTKPTGCIVTADTFQSNGLKLFL